MISSASVCVYVCICVILHNSGVIDHPLSSCGEMCEQRIFIISGRQEGTLPSQTQMVLLLTHVATCMSKERGFLRKGQHSTSWLILYCSTVGFSSIIFKPWLIRHKRDMDTWNPEVTDSEKWIIIHLDNDSDHQHATVKLDIQIGHLLSTLWNYFKVPAHKRIEWTLC